VSALYSSMVIVGGRPYRARRSISKCHGHAVGEQGTPLSPCATRWRFETEDRIFDVTPVITGS
jgi:hypothetical protein